MHHMLSVAERTSRCRRRRAGRQGLALSLVLLSLAAIQTAAAPSQRPGTAREPVVGLPCEGCELVFDGMPATLASSARIAPPGEAGEAMILEGVVRDRQGRAAPGVIVYAYHTDDTGVYPGQDASRRTTGVGMHGRLRGWARTDAQGRYRFETIRPAGYPGTRAPAHVHVHIIEPGCCTYYVEEVVFADDTRLSAEHRERATRGRGGSGLVTPTRTPDGAWHATHDIVLGLGVPGYR